MAVGCSIMIICSCYGYSIAQGNWVVEVVGEVQILTALSMVMQVHKHASRPMDYFDEPCGLPSAESHAVRAGRPIPEASKRPVLRHTSSVSVDPSFLQSAS